MNSTLFQAFIYLLAAVIIVPLAKRLRLGSVLGYLVAGVVIGPAVLDLVGSSESVRHFSEFGVVMMLFIIGLELRPRLLWRLRVPILGLGGLQVACVGLLGMGVAIALGVAWKAALAIGLLLALSSTALVLQSLAERGELKLNVGQSCFSVLLFQDIAVIPILAILPMLGTGTALEGHGVISHLLPWQRAIATIGAVVGILLIGRFVLRHVFRFVAESRLREVFTELTLVLVIGTTLLMEAVGLSAALGAFISGVVLADSEYRHQLEADIEPFKGILLGVFFTAVGAGIDFPFIASHPAQIAGIIAALVAGKFAIQLVLARLFRLDWSQAFLFAIALAQAGEFAFVLLGVAGSTGVLPADIGKLLTVVVALSMALTPLWFLLHDRLIRPIFSRGPQEPERKPDEIHEANPVILAGFGRFGHIVGRLLRANGIGCTVLENDTEQIELLAKFGMKSYFGDATRMDLLRSAGADNAKVFICTLADPEKSVQIVRAVKREFPHLRIFARAVSRQHAYDLIRAGVEDIFRETLGSALDLSVAAMRQLGFRAVQALRAARIFKEYDEASVRDMAHLVGNEKEFTSRGRQHIANLERILQQDRARLASTDDAWTTDPAEPK